MYLNKAGDLKRERKEEGKGEEERGKEEKGGEQRGGEGRGGVGRREEGRGEERRERPRCLAICNPEWPRVRCCVSPNLKNQVSTLAEAGMSRDKTWEIRLGDKQTHEGSPIPQLPPRHFLCGQGNECPAVKDPPPEPSWKQGYVGFLPTRPIVSCCSGVRDRMYGVNLILWAEGGMPQAVARTHKPQGKGHKLATN